MAISPRTSVSELFFHLRGQHSNQYTTEIASFLQQEMLFTVVVFFKVAIVIEGHPRKKFCDRAIGLEGDVV